MAVVNTKAAVITSMDSVPVQHAPAALVAGNRKESRGSVSVVNGDSIGSTFRLARIPSNAYVSAVILRCGAITTGAADVGLYQTAQNGGAVVDADFFASAVAIATANIAMDVTHESGVFGIEKTEQPLWQALGLPADPGRDYDVVATLTGAATATAPLSILVGYTTNQ